MTETLLYLDRTIDSSHIIDGHPGKCGRLHGHTWRFEVWLRGTVAEDGMLVDFLEIKAAIDAWDHRHLNDIVDVIPTAENLAALMQQTLLEIVRQRAGDSSAVSVRVWETPNAYAQVGDAVQLSSAGGR